MQIAWITDIHLNFVDSDGIERFCNKILSTDADAVLLSGDIGEAPTLGSYLDLLQERLRRPIYFVLGNHDFYQGAIVDVRNQAVAITQQSPWLRWLPAVDGVELTPQVALVGHDGWSDGRLGEFHGSSVRLNDYELIEELRGLAKPALLAKLNALGDEAASYLHRVLLQVLPHFAEVIVLTHVPPFREACLYQGKPGDDEWLPHFTCNAVGDMLVKMAKGHPDHRLTVLCGHAHHAAEVQMLPNLWVKTGAATYREPQLQTVLTFE